MRITLETAERVAFAGGASFGEVGPYERLAGKIRLAVDPKAPQNRVIVDLDKAPKGPDGLVECVADYTILKPVDLARGNRRLFYDWGNRGNIRCLQFFNDAPAGNAPRDLAHAGNGFLFRRGYTVAWVAWEGDLLPGDGRFVLETPVATENGKPITGRVRVEYVLDEPAKSMPISGRASTRCFPTVSLDTSKASLTVRPYPGEPRVQIDPSRWQFARLEGGAGLDGQGGETGVAPSDQHIYYPDGFQPGLIYELVYTARDPRVHGLGHAMVRDAIAFLRNDASDKNPLKGGIDKAYCWGRSQTGRAIRDYIYLGFNDDGQGRKVFDGVLPHVAGAGKQWFNHRFSLPVVPAGQQQEDHDNIADRFPFSYASSTDHNTGKVDAILTRPKTDPLSSTLRPRPSTGSGGARWSTPTPPATI